MLFPKINRRLGAAVLFCVAGLSLWSCSQSSGPLVIVTVDSSEVPDVTRLVVNSTLNERPLEQKEYTEDFGTFGLRLPGGSEGEFRASIEGQRTDMTRIAIVPSDPIAVSGQGTFPISVKLGRIQVPPGPLKVSRVEGLPGNHLYAVWGTSSGEVWVGGEQTLRYRSKPGAAWVDQSWDPFNAGDTKGKYTIRGLWGTTPANMWAVGEFTNQSPAKGDMGASEKTYPAAYSVGGNWQLIPSAETIALKSVRGTSSTRVFASGSYSNRGGETCPSIFRLSKDQITGPNTNSSYCRSSAGSNSINALWVGKTTWGAGFFENYSGSGALLVYIGEPSRWLERPAMHASALTGIWSNEDGSSWSVSSTSAILRKPLNADVDMGVDGWQLSPSPADAPLAAVWGFSNSDVWVVGARGTVLHYGESGVWEKVTSEPPTSEDLWAVWGRSPDDVWIVGNGGTVYHYP